MRILFLSHYFPPEGNAPATRIFEMTRRWVRAGHDVEVITGVPNVPNGIVYEGYRNRFLIQHETLEGIRVTRVWTYVAPNKGTVRRILNYLSFMISATLAGLRAPRPDVVVATSPQFFCGWAGVFVSRLRHRPFILEIRDIWPESIATVGAIRQPVIIRFLSWLEKRLYAAARLIVTVGEGYRRQLEARSVPASRIQVVTNGVDLNTYAPHPPDASLRSTLGFAQRDFVCAYVGTIGMACGLDVVLRAARLLKDRKRSDIQFLLVGDGAVRAELEASARKDGLANVTFTGLQRKENIPQYLSLADACLVHLKKQDLFKSVFPSKMLEAAAMMKPIILGVEGFAAQLVDEAKAGICIEPDNEEALARAVTELADNRTQAQVFGRNGYEGLARKYDWDRLADHYLKMLEDISHD